MMSDKPKNIPQQVSQYNTEGFYIKTYQSLSQAAIAIGIDVRTIQKKIATKQAYEGFFWRLGKDKNQIDLEEVRQAFEEQRTTIRNINSKQVARYTLDGELMDYYPSVKEAARLLNTSTNSLFEALKGRQLATKGYIWRYIDSPENIPSRIEVEKIKPAQLKSELRKKLGLTKFKYPYQDMNLIDLEDEVWKPVPGLEEYAWVSNLGRIKNLPRYVNGRLGARIFMKEKINKQSVRRMHLSKQREVYQACLYFKIHVDGTIYQAPVARAVYSAFVEPLKDFFDEKIYILHHDLNPYNNTPENLYPATHEEMAFRNIREGLLIVYYNPEKIEKMNREIRKPISQYDRNGKFIRSFSSITDAAKTVGINHASIGDVAREEGKHATGYIWRYGTDTTPLDKEILSKYTNPRLRVSFSVSCYDMDNNFLASYPSMRAAALTLGFDDRKLGALLKKGNGTAEFEGFIWKYDKEQDFFE